MAADLCALLREMLVEAEAGRLRGFVGIVQKNSHDTQVVWSTDGAHSALIWGALRMVMNDFEDRLKEKLGR